MYHNNFGTTTTFYNSNSSFFSNRNNKPKGEHKGHNSPPSNGSSQLDRYGSLHYNTFPSQKKWSDKWTPNDRNFSDNFIRPRRDVEPSYSAGNGDNNGAKAKVKPNLKPFNHDQQQQQQPKRLDLSPAKEGAAEAEHVAVKEENKDKSANPRTKGRDKDGLTAERASSGDRSALTNGQRPMNRHRTPVLGNRSAQPNVNRNVRRPQNPQRPSFSYNQNNNINNNKPRQNGFSKNWDDFVHHSRNSPHNNNPLTNWGCLAGGVSQPVDHLRQEKGASGIVEKSISLNCLRKLELLKSEDEKPPELTNGSQWDTLSIDIWSKFKGSQQCMSVLQKKIFAWNALNNSLKQTYGDTITVFNPVTMQPVTSPYGLYMVGSTFTGFGLDESDVDLCFMIHNVEVDQRFQALSFLKNFSDFLVNSQVTGCKKIASYGETDGIQIEARSLKLIHAKVPVLKFTDWVNGIQFDVNCNNPVGVHNTHLLSNYCKTEWRVAPLVILVKVWAKFHDINDAKEMTLSSYSLTLMVIHYLQYGVRPVVLPCLQKMYHHKFKPEISVKSLGEKFLPNETVKPFNSDNVQPLGELLAGFFQYYSTFNFAQNAISVRLGTIVPVDSCRFAKTPKNDPTQWKYICIEEPYEQTNTARSVFDLNKFQYIVEVFRFSANALSQTKRLDSVFTRIPASASTSRVPSPSTQD